MKKLPGFVLFALIVSVFTGSAFSESAIAIRNDIGTASTAAGFKLQRQTLVFQLNEIQAPVRLSISDLRGRTVWSRRVSASEARTQVMTASAIGMGPGNYIVRVADLSGLALHESRFTYAP
jgi:hypothetical protein